MFKKFFIITLSLLFTASVVAGCGSSNDNEEVKGKVNLAYVSWSDSVAVTNVAAAVLEEKMGYEVNLTLADIAPVLASVASGSTDAYLDVWLPYTHSSYMEEYGEDMVDYGVVYDGAMSGLVVPAYVDINSIEELNANKDLFGGEIIGIDPGAGLMGLTETTLEEYGLDYTIQSGSATTMTAALSKALNANEPIVVTGWSPHWKFARWDLKFLEDPKGTFGESESAYKYVRKGFDEDMPEVAEFFKNYRLETDDVAELMGEIEDGEKDPMQIAKDWVEANADVVNGWLPE